MFFIIKAEGGRQHKREVKGNGVYTETIALVEKIKLDLSQEPPRFVNIDMAKLRLRQLKEDLLPQLTTEEKETLKDRLPDLQPGKGESLEDLLRRLEAQLLALEAKACVEMIDFWLSQESLGSIEVYAINRNLERLSSLPINDESISKSLSEFANKLEISQQQGQPLLSSEIHQVLREQFAQLKEQILNAIEQPAQPNLPEQAELQSE